MEAKGEFSVSTARLLLGFNALAGVVGSELSRAGRNSHACAQLSSALGTSAMSGGSSTQMTLLVQQ